MVYYYPIFAQKQFKNILKTNLISPMAGAFHLNYERKINNKFSAQIGFMYGGNPFLNISGFENNYRSNGIAVTPELRFYIEKQALKGFFFAISPRYKYFQLLGNTMPFYQTKAHYSSIGAGLLVGYQWLLDKKISLETYLGYSINKGQLTIISGTQENFNLDYFRNRGFRVGFTLGIPF